MPIIASTIEWTGIACFSQEWAGFPVDKAITVLIGRNNSGKSRLLGLAEEACAPRFPEGRKMRFTSAIGDDVATEIMSNVGRRWSQSTEIELHKKWSSSEVRWTFTSKLGGRILGELQPPVPELLEQDGWCNSRDHWIKFIAERVQTESPWGNKVYRHLAAERDIVPEAENRSVELAANGRGATNIIRSVLLDDNRDEKLVSIRMLDALNKILGGEHGNFTAIRVKRSQSGHYEVNLEEDHKGLVPLSSSGSGLKTLVLVLLHILVMPQLEEGVSLNRIIFAFEELENNLHPALLRRLLASLADFVEESGAKLFLTTHSSTVLDLYGHRSDCQFIHVAHNKKYATTTVIGETLSHHKVISDLGVRPSDLLQANGIIWVEGPSDRLYLNRWISLATEGRFQEGAHYQCAFYAGSLLANTQLSGERYSLDEYVNLMRINRNLAVVFDSDITASSGPGSEIKERVRRIKAEAAALDAMTWTTWGKEVENYLPLPVLKGVFGDKITRAPTRHERFFPSKNAKLQGTSYLEAQAKRGSIQKVDLASMAVPHFTKELLQADVPLWSQLQELVTRIAHWNK